MPKQPVAIRTNNPGAMWPGPAARRHGMTGYENLADGNKAAVFDDPIDGAAAQFDLWASKYAGMTLRDAIRQWSGNNSADQYATTLGRQLGISPDTVLTKDMLHSPQGIAAMKQQAQWEAGRPFPLTDQQWDQAQTRAFGIKNPPLPPEKPAQDQEVAANYAEAGDPVAQTVQNIAQGKQSMAGMSPSDSWIERVLRKALDQDIGPPKGGDKVPPKTDQPANLPATRRTTEPTQYNKPQTSLANPKNAPTAMDIYKDLEGGKATANDMMPNMGTTLTIPVGIAASEALNNSDKGQGGSPLDVLPDWLHHAINNVVNYGSGQAKPAAKDAAPEEVPLPQPNPFRGTVELPPEGQVPLPPPRPNAQPSAEQVQQAIKNPPLPQPNPLRNNQPVNNNTINQQAAAAAGFDGNSREMMMAVNADQQGQGLLPMFQQYTPQQQQDAMTMPIDISSFFGGGSE